MSQLVNHHDQSETKNGQYDPQNKFDHEKNSLAVQRAHWSLSKMDSSVIRPVSLCFESVLSTILAMSVKRIWPFRKA